MGKILSVLEKYKLIEKEDDKMSSSDSPVKNNSDAKEFNPQQNSDSSSEDTANYENNTNSAAPAPKNDTQDASHPSARYNKNMSLEEIYTLYGLGDSPVTETVFVLENLMKALPDELPEYVKKTTLNNILIASSMNLTQLLADGNNRYNSLDAYSHDYISQNENDIAALKKEIDKLSAMINDYHQQIKNKEYMVKEQISLIKLEEERLQNILGFFEK